MSRIQEQKLNRMSLVLALLLFVFIGLPFTVSAMMQPTIINVAAGANLQTVIDSAPAGAVLRLPDAAQYSQIVIGKPLSIESTGTRVVTAAPGIQFQVGAKISTAIADPAVYVKPGTTGVHFKGVEISAAGFVYDIVRLGASSNDQPTLQNTLDKVPSNISFENVWIHGATDQDSQRGIAANAANLSVTNSRIDEIHARGADSQAICAWNGPGPFHILNNHLEASGENVLFGGFDPSIPNLIPSDIEIRNNYFFKPLRWKVGDPSYTGIHWSVKNLLEIKMGRNVVIDGNTMENSWGDAQIGYGVLFTVRNQDGKAPWAILENIQFTNNIVKNTEQGIQLLGKDSPNISQQSTGLLISNNSFTGIKNWFLVVAGYNNVTVEHNTHLQGGNFIVATGQPSLNFIYRNNATLRTSASFGIKGDGTEEGTSTINAYFPSAVIAGNVIAGALDRIYPVGNFFPVDLSGLPNFKGTDGLAPGYSAGVTIPLPSPTPTVTPVPSPSPSPTPIATPTPTPQPTPTPLPSPTPVPTPTPCMMTVSSPMLTQWSSGKLVVNLSGFTSPSTLTATQTSGQVTVDWPTSRSISGSSVIAEFGIESKKKSSSVVVSGPCGSKTVLVNVQ
jgi:hypothetical protein